MGTEILRLPVVDTGGVQAKRCDCTILHQPARRFGRQPGKVQLGNRFRPGKTGAQVGGPVLVAFTPAGSDQQNCTVWNSLMARFPFLQVGFRNLVVRMCPI